MPTPRLSNTHEADGPGLWQARPLLEQAIGIWRQTLGSEHSRVAIGLNNLALCHEKLGQLKDALPLYQESLACLVAQNILQLRDEHALGCR